MNNIAQTVKQFNIELYDLMDTHRKRDSEYFKKERDLCKKYMHLFEYPDSVDSKVLEFIENSLANN